MISGGCLCCSVRFHIRGPLRAARYCHCGHCRKFSGTSPAAWAMISRSDLDCETPDAEIGRFNSGRGLRCFCATCSSPVWFESLDFADIVAVPLGVLDGGDLPMPQMHLWVSSKPEWCSINDGLPEFAEGPP